MALAGGHLDSRGRRRPRHLSLLATPSPSAHITTVLSFVALTITLVWLAAIVTAPVVSADPAYMQRTFRLGKTFAYTMDGQEPDTSTSGWDARFGVSSLPLSPGAQGISIFSEAENKLVASMLRAYSTTAESSGNEGGYANVVFPADLTTAIDSTVYKSMSKAVLAASFVKDCTFSKGSTCPAYWVVGNVARSIPLASVPATHLFWNGTHAVNGFYTNFTSKYIASIGNPVTVHPLSAIAVDAHGEWRVVSESTSRSLRQVDLSAADASGTSVGQRRVNAMATEAATLLGNVPEASSSEAPAENTTYAPAQPSLNFMPYVPALIVAIVLLVLLLFVLILLYTFDYKPRKERLDEFRQSFPDALSKSASGSPVAGGNGSGYGESDSCQGTRRISESRRRKKQKTDSSSGNESVNRGGAYLGSPNSLNASFESVKVQAGSVGKMQSSESQFPQPTMPTSMLPQTKELSLSPFSVGATDTATMSSTSPSRGYVVPSPSPFSRSTVLHDTAVGMGTGNVGVWSLQQQQTLSRAAFSNSLSARNSGRSSNAIGSVIVGGYHGTQGFPAAAHLTHTHTGSGGGGFGGISGPLPQLPTAPIVPPFSSSPCAPTNLDSRSPSPRQQSWERPSALPRRPSLGSRGGSSNSVRSSNSLNSVSDTHAFAYAHPTAPLAQQQQPQPTPSPTPTPTSILVKESSFRKDKKTSVHGASVSTAATRNSTQSAPPAPVLSLRSPQQQQQQLAVSASTAEVVSASSSQHMTPTRVIAAAAVVERRKRASSTPQANPFRDRDSFRKVF